jgi:serine/threonine protein kinase
VQAIEKLCGPGTHVNIVQVFDHGLLSRYPYYFIDMELCAFNLQDFIHRKSPESSEPIPYLSQLERDDSISQIWTIMSQIASAVEYIRRQGRVHRDIKPANGNSLPSLTDLASAVLE